VLLQIADASTVVTAAVRLSALCAIIPAMRCADAGAWDNSVLRIEERGLRGACGGAAQHIAVAMPRFESFAHSSGDAVRQRSGVCWPGKVTRAVAAFLVAYQTISRRRPTGHEPELTCDATLKSGRGAITLRQSPASNNGNTRQLSQSF